MAERVLPHRHCKECGTSIGVKEEFCSKDCRQKAADRLRQKRRQLLFLYAGGVGMFGLAMLLLLGRFG